MFEKVHHVCYVVTDMDQVTALFSGKYEIKLLRQWAIEKFDTKFALYRVGENLIEVLQPCSPASGHYHVMQERGNCLDHVAYGVHDLDGVMKTLQERGITFQRERPHTPENGTGWRIANISREGGSLGIYIQLVDLDWEAARGWTAQAR